MAVTIREKSQRIPYDGRDVVNAAYSEDSAIGLVLDWKSEGKKDRGTGGGSM